MSYQVSISNIVPMGRDPYLMPQQYGSMDFSAALTYTTSKTVSLLSV